MKYLFLFILGSLVLVSVQMSRSMPDATSAIPVLHWVTDANPAREDQVHLFHLWQVKHGYRITTELSSLEATNSFLSNQGRLLRRSLLELNPPLAEIADGHSVGVNWPLTITLPKAELRLDSGNADLSKRIIQGVSGVGGDLMDVAYGEQMWQLQGMGLLRDVTEDAKRLGFDLSQTYQALAPEIAIRRNDAASSTGTADEWRQYQFPCNVASAACIVNLDAFEKVGMAPPPRRWTIAEFEQMGREYIRRANADPARPRFFFIGSIDHSILRRAFGASDLNETMTACTLDDPRSVAAMEKFLQWQNVDRLVPSAVDRAGFSTDSGYGGQDLQLFNAGNYAMTIGGRYSLIQFRKFNIDRVSAGGSPLRLAMSEHPHKVFPNTNLTTRAAAVYAGSKHQDLAVLFQAYLASDDYNMQIVDDADSLPPVPAYTRRAQYERPAPDPTRGIYPETEWGLHAPLVETAETIAVAGSYSPFILRSVLQRELLQAEEAATSGARPPGDAFADARRRIDAEIARNLAENLSLQPLYERKLNQQKVIDEMKEAIGHVSRSHPGQPIPEALKVPLSLIDNPFHRAFYLYRGWAKVDEPDNNSRTPGGTQPFDLRTAAQEEQR